MRDAVEENNNTRHGPATNARCAPCYKLYACAHPRRVRGRSWGPCCVVVRVALTAGAGAPAARGAPHGLPASKRGLLLSVNLC